MSYAPCRSCGPSIQGAAEILRRQGAFGGIVEDTADAVYTRIKSNFERDVEQYMTEIVDSKALDDYTTKKQNELLGALAVTAVVTAGLTWWLIRRR